MLNQAFSHWSALQQYRSERTRCKNYTYGRQYLDLITVDHKRITEEEYIRSEGNVPLKNNLIRRIVRNVLGVFRNNMRFPSAESLGLSENDPDDILIARRLKESIREENLRELFARLMEEYLIGGMVVVRKRASFTPAESMDTFPVVHTEIVYPESFFFNTDSTDPRGRDISVIGEIHTIPLETAISHFAATPDDIPLLRRHACESHSNPLRSDGQPYIRIVEMWRLEPRRFWLCHDRRQGRKFMSLQKPSDEDIDAVWSYRSIWRYYFIAPDGSILKEGDSPLGEAGHPYVFKAYPFIDGEIHSFVADCIDQQRYINRLITLHDWILRSSAKGVLIFPEGSLPEEMEMEEISDQWARFNGVISYRHQEGVPAPYQVSQNATNIGLSELLSVQLKMMEDVSGVNSALQGQLSSGAVSGTLFELQTRQALSGLADIIEGFENFMRDCALKEIALMRRGSPAAGSRTAAVI